MYNVHDIEYYQNKNYYFVQYLQVKILFVDSRYSSEYDDIKYGIYVNIESPNYNTIWWISVNIGTDIILIKKVFMLFPIAIDVFVIGLFIDYWIRRNSTYRAS